MVLIALAGSAPMLAVLCFNEYSAREARYKEIHEIAQASAQQAALEIQRLVVGAENVLKAVAAAPAVKALDADRCGPYLNELKSRVPELSVLVVLDLNGNSRCRSDDAATGVNSSDRSYFRDAIVSPGKMVIGEYTVSRTTGRPGLPLALAVPDGRMLPTMVVVAGLDLEWLGGTLSSRVLAKDGSLTIADREGVILAREPLPERFVGTKIPAQFMTLVKDQAPSTLEVTSQDGTQRILGYIPSTLPPEGIYVSVGISVDEAFREINDGTYRAVVIATLARKRAHGAASASPAVASGGLRRWSAGIVSIDPLAAVTKTSIIAHSMADDEILKNSFANFAFEHFEIAAYNSLLVMAELGGFQAATAALKQNLSEEGRHGGLVKR